MTKTELIKIVSDETGLSLAKTDNTLKAFLKVIGNADEVTIVGFGKFKWKTRAARKGRNPSTGLEMDIPASTSLHFKAAPALSKL